MDQPGNLAVGQLPAEFQGDDLHRTGIEALQGSQDLFLILNKHERLLGLKLILHGQIEIIKRSERVGCLCFPMVDTQVVGNREQPCLDLTLARVILPQVGKRLFEHGRSQVVGRVGIRAPVAEVTENSRVIGIEYLVKGDGFGCSRGKA